MLKVILLAVMMVVLLSIGSRHISLANSLDLSQFQWKNRLLFLFSPNRDHPFFDVLHKSLTTRKQKWQTATW